MKYVKGKEVVIEIRTPNGWKIISCEKSNTLSEDIDTKETTTRDNGGWKTYVTNNQGYSLDFTAMTMNDVNPQAPVVTYIVSYAKLTNMKQTREEVDWRRTIKYPNGDTYTEKGTAIITSIGSPANADGLLTFNVSMIGQGKIEKEINA